mmetsp:Transcript_60703/g.120272  ORF Transcript_60703/g.120272 Transcript_60703/m.120272 type:complete len:86 (-) Transcript_60703:751-1008(-)
MSCNQSSPQQLQVVNLRAAVDAARGCPNGTSDPLLLALPESQVPYPSPAPRPQPMRHSSDKATRQQLRNNMQALFKWFTFNPCTS